MARRYRLLLTAALTLEFPEAQVHRCRPAIVGVRPCRTPLRRLRRLRPRTFRAVPRFTARSSPSHARPGSRTAHGDKSGQDRLAVSRRGLDEGPDEERRRPARPGVGSASVSWVCRACGPGVEARVGRYRQGAQLVFRLIDHVSDGGSVSFLSTDQSHAAIKRVSPTSWTIRWDDSGGCNPECPDQDFDDLVARVPSSPNPSCATVALRDRSSTNPGSVDVVGTDWPAGQGRQSLGPGRSRRLATTQRFDSASCSGETPTARHHAAG